MVFPSIFILSYKICAFPARARWEFHNVCREKIFLKNTLTVQLLYGLRCLLQEANKNERRTVWKTKMSI